MAEQLSFFDADSARPAAPAAVQRQPIRNVLFFAIFPPPEIAAGISERWQLLCRKLGLRGRLVAQDRLHVSLCQVGSYDALPQDVVSAACAAAASVTAAPFDACFDRAITFRSNAPKKPIVLVSGGVIQPLLDLERRLGAALAEAGLMARPASTFTPHVTLAYGEGFTGEQALDPVAWTVNEFALIHSFHGKTRHIFLGRWRLRG